jgi:hypothetical protein
LYSIGKVLIKEFELFKAAKQFVCEVGNKEIVAEWKVVGVVLLFCGWILYIFVKLT